MRKLAWFAAPVLLSLAAVIAVLLFLRVRNAKGALQVTSIPQSEVFLNGKLIGKTPLCRCDSSDMLLPKEYSLTLVPPKPFSPFEHTVVIEPSVLTVVDRTFAEGEGGEGSIVTLQPLPTKKISEILILSFPAGASVLLDSNASGTTPTLIKNVTDSDHTLALSKEGYQDKTVRIRTTLGYKVEALVFLGVRDDLLASESAIPSATLTATPVLSSPKILILQTPTGFLRVRENPSIASTEVGRVKPGERFDLIDEQPGWFQILFAQGQRGFVSAQYARKEE